VLDPAPPRRRRLWHPGLTSPDPAERLAALLARRPDGIAADQLPLLLGVAPTEARRAAAVTPGVRQVGSRWVEDRMLAELAARALAGVKAYHRSQPGDPGMPLETLRRLLRAPEALVETVLGDLVAAGRLRVAGAVARLSGFVPRVEGGDAEVDRFVRILEEAGLSPPSLPELERQTGRRDVAIILRLAARDGRVEAVERERYYARAALERFRAALAELGRDRLIAPSELRERLGISRKYVIPLLEWADAQGITERVAAGRKLRNA
jgi:selenocysteine-specific elongation factor